MTDSNALTPEERAALAAEAEVAEKPDSQVDDFLEAELAKFDLDKPSVVNERSSDALQEELPVDEVAEVPPSDQIDSEPSEAPLVADSELPPLDDRIKEFELPESPKQPSPRDLLKQQEIQLQQEAAYFQRDFLADLPQLSHNGKRLYDMTPTELNDALVELQDKGQAYQAGQLQSYYTEAQQRAQTYQSRAQRYQEAKTQLDQMAEQVDWLELDEEFSKKLPELSKEDKEKAGQYIAQQRQADAIYNSVLKTKEGKAQKVIESLNKLSIIARLKEARKEQDPPQDAAPSAPDDNTKFIE